MKRLICVFLFSLLAISLVPAVAHAQTILLVRHAEKISSAPDATLSDVGKKRAEKLAHMLADAGITAIYISEVDRTKQTAAPLAKLLNFEPVVVPAKDTSGLLGKLRAASDSAVILVVGHSNTIPRITDELLSATLQHPRDNVSTAMKDGDYDRLYIVTLNRGGTPKLLILHY